VGPSATGFFNSIGHFCNIATVSGAHNTGRGGATLPPQIKRTTERFIYPLAKAVDPAQSN